MPLSHTRLVDNSVGHSRHTASAVDCAQSSLLPVGRRVRPADEVGLMYSLLSVCGDATIVGVCRLIASSSVICRGRSILRPHANEFAQDSLHCLVCLAVDITDKQLLVH